MKTDGLKEGVRESPSPQNETDSPLRGESVSGPSAAARGAEGSAKATPTKERLSPFEGQNGKGSPLEPRRRSASPADSAPPRASVTSSAEPLPKAELPPKAESTAGEPIPQRPQRAAAADPGHSAAVGQGSTSEGGSFRVSAVSGASKDQRPEPADGEDGKERRGKRYTTFQSVRKGLAQVANELALGKTDAKTAAVRVQALQAIANVLAQTEYAKLSAEAEALEKQAKEPSKAVARA